MKQILRRKYIFPQPSVTSTTGRIYSCLYYMLPAFFMFFLVTTPAAAQLTRVWETPSLNTPTDGSMRTVDQAVDPEKNLLVTGSMSTTVNDRATVLYKVDPAGNKIWSRIYPGESGSISNYPEGLWVDGNGNSYILATTDMAGTYKSILIRYSSTGALVWSKTLEYGSLLTKENIAVGADNSIYITGYRFIDSKGYVITQKWNSEGSVVWTSQYEPPVFDRGGDFAITVDNKGGVYVGIDAHGFSSTQTQTLLKYNATTGSQNLVQQFGGSPSRNIESPQKIMVSPSGMIYIFTNISNAYYNDLILYVMTSAGVVSNRVQVGEGQDIRFNPIFYLQEAAFTQDESLIILCTNAKYRTTPDYFLAKHSKGGARQWIKSFNIYEGETIKQFLASGMALLGDGRIIVSGSYSVFDEINGSPYQIKTFESSKLALAVFDQTGKEIWRYVNLEDGNTENFGLDVSRVSVNSVYVLGEIATSPHAVYAMKFQDCSGFTASAGSDKQICAGGNVQLQATGGTTYSWSPATGLSATNVANPTASPAQTTTYTVTVTNAEGCTATDQVTVTVNPVPAATITASGATTFCEGSSVTLTANTGSGLTYQWLKDGNVINNATGSSFTTQASGAYAVRVSNSTGCNTTSAVTKVTVTTPPTVNAGENQSICENASALTLSGFSPAGGTWSGPGVSANGLFNPATAGVGTHTLTYTVTQNSCTVKSTKTITVTPAVAAAGTITGDATVCAGATGLTYSIPAVTGATSYTWSVPAGFTITGGQGSRTITVTAGTASGSIFVKAQNSCGSSEPATMAVNVSAVPTAAIMPDGSTALCAGGSVKLTATTGTGLTYQWLRNGSAISNATGSTYTATTAGDYAVVIQNAGGCPATSTAVRVTVAAAVTASAGEDKTICAGGSVQLQASGGTTYSWSPATGLSATNVANPTATPGQTTTYTVTVSNANGCTATDQVTVTVNAAPTATITTTGNTTFCEGGSVTLQASTGDNYSYQWQRNGTAISGATAATYNATQSGNYTVTISSGSCQATAQAVAVNVSSNVRSNSIASGNQTLCGGAAAEMLQGSTPTGGAGTYSYQWQQSTDGNSYTSIQGATTQNYSPGTLNATTWFRRVVTSGSCSSTSEAVKITLAPAPTVSLSAFDKTCVGGTTITLTGGQPAGGNYSGPGVSNGIFNPATAGEGTHTITYSYTNASNCSATATQTIVVEATCTPTGVEDEEPPHKFVMFPNPAKDKLYLEVDLPQRTDATLRLVDARGRIILEKVYTGQAGAFTETIQLEQAARGLYILQFTTKEGMYSRRVVLW